MENPDIGVLELGTPGAPTNNIVPKSIEVQMDFSVVHEHMLGWTKNDGTWTFGGGDAEDKAFPYYVKDGEEDTDGDLVEDNWETNNFGMPAAEVSAIADPDDDGIPNYMEFAFFTDPLSPNAAPPAVSVDEGSHPVLTYQRHITAPNYYNFDIETSMNGDHWERLSNLETLTIRPIGALAESIVTRCLVDTHQLGLSFYRIRVTPRS